MIQVSFKLISSLKYTSGYEKSENTPIYDCPKYPSELDIEYNSGYQCGNTIKSGCWFHHNVCRIDRYEGRSSKERKNVNSCVGWLDPSCVASREWVDMYKYFGNSPTFSRLNGHRVYLNNLKSFLRREGVIGYISSFSHLSSIRCRI